MGRIKLGACLPAWREFRTSYASSLLPSGVQKSYVDGPRLQGVQFDLAIWSGAVICPAL